MYLYKCNEQVTNYHFSSPKDLQKVIYMDNNTSTLLDTDCTISSNSEKVDPQTSDNRTGIRTMCVSPDGLHLASGDRNGTLRSVFHMAA